MAWIGGEESEGTDEQIAHLRHGMVELHNVLDELREIGSGEGVAVAFPQGLRGNSITVTSRRVCRSLRLVAREGCPDQARLPQRDRAFRRRGFLARRAPLATVLMRPC